MKKFSKATAAAVQDPRAMARFALVFMAAVLVMLLGLMSFGSGPGGQVLFAQEEPSPTEPPSTEPAIQLINPSETPDVTARPDDTAPAVSDRNDGADETYHIVAVSRNAPANAIVEAYVTPITALGVELPEQTIGLMTRLADSPDTWELHWDIPADVPDGNARMTVRMYDGGTSGQIAEDAVDVRIRKTDVTVELTWPTNGGPLGFYKPRGGAWRTLIDATRSSGNSLTYFFYTVSPPGTQPEWKQCASQSGSGQTRVECTLLDKDTPSQVSAVYAIASEATGLAATRILESGDAHRVKSFVQDPHQMKVQILPSDTSDTDGGFRQRSNTKCIAFITRVTDQHDRPVQGANVDVHATGPTDQLRFGEEISDSTIGETTTTDHKPPDKGNHSIEPGANCDRGPQEDPQDLPEAQPTKGQQGDHNIVAQSDIKHREAAPAGTGRSQGTSSFGAGTAGFGELLFELFSPANGLTNVTAWVDDEPIANETEVRAADSDTLDAPEPRDEERLQWLPGDITVQFDPPGDTAQVGTCNRYVVKVRGGTAPVPDINVDVHATGPTNDLDFCDPGDGTPRSAPDSNTGDEKEHEAEDAGEAHHRGDPPVAQHTEGQTDEAGNFVIGITSPVTGDTTLEAWVDGEEEANDDVRGSSEAVGRATKSWVASLADAQISFVNPSPYGGSGTRVSNKPDANSTYHIVTRVDAFDVPGVELFISSDSGTTFQKIGDAQRVGASDTWEFYWDVAVPDRSYVLRAQITGTDRREDITITVNKEDGTGDDPTDFAFETLEITRPFATQSVPFSNRETIVEGVVSEGTEGVDLFYTKVAAKDTPASADWISCGFTEPNEDRSFQGTCTLQGSDQASSVTGIAAITYDCTDADCNPAPGSGGIPREPGQRDSGDAHRVFGFEGRPAVSIEPAETTARPGSCQRMVMSVADETGQALADQNVDVHATGPTDDVQFCDPDGGASPRTAPDQGNHATQSGQEDEGAHQESSPSTKHTEGTTNSSGRFVFGVISGARGDSQLLGWVDQNNNDVQDDEPSDTAVIRWGQTSGGGGGDQLQSGPCKGYAPNSRQQKSDGSGLVIVGTSGPDDLRGGSGNDLICGLGGRDAIRGRGGADRIFGGGGHDDIRGNAGNDTIGGNAGLDVIRAGGGADVVRGGGQDDTIRGYIGRDRLVGGPGNDTLRGGRHNDRLVGNKGDDLLGGGAGFDTCRPGPGNDTRTSCEN